jgi:hypothetical protein
VEGEIFRTRPDLPCGPPSLLYNGYQVFPEGKAAGAWCYHPAPSSAEIKKECSYTSTPSGHSGLLRGTFTFFFNLGAIWGGWPKPRSGHFTPGSDPVPIVQEAGWASEPDWAGMENLAPTGIRSLNRPVVRH